MPDDLKFVLGPLLALVPLVALEYWLKPARVRRNVALSVLAEVDLNLAWLLRTAAARTHRPDKIPAHSAVRKMVVSSNASALGELSPEIAAEVLSFYSGMEEIVATVETLHNRSDELRLSTDNARRSWLRDSIARGQGSLTSYLPAISQVGSDVRVRLHELAASVTFMPDIPPLRPFEQLVGKAVNSEIARQLAEGEASGTS